jgi:hypothetical protein
MAASAKLRPGVVCTILGGLLLAALPLAPARACSLLGQSAQEDTLVEWVNTYRESFQRGPVDGDTVLATVADVVSTVVSNEGNLLKIRAQSRNFLLDQFTTVRILVMKGKKLEDVWRRMTNNTYPSSVLRREGAQHIGVGIVDNGSNVWVTLIMGGDLITPLGCLP